MKIFSRNKDPMDAIWNSLKKGGWSYAHTVMDGENKVDCIFKNGVYLTCGLALADCAWAWKIGVKVEGEVADIMYAPRRIIDKIHEIKDELYKKTKESAESAKLSAKWEFERRARMTKVTELLYDK